MYAKTIQLLTSVSARLVLVIAATTAMACPFWTAATACPFCSAQGTTLTKEIAEASMVLYGTLANAQLNANGLGQGTTDLTIESVLKSHEILGDQKVVTLPRYVPSDNAAKKILVFCDVFKGKIDPYRGVPVDADGEIVKYLKGALAVKDKDIPTRLKFFFQYLDSKDSEVSNDAYKEFAYADYKEFGEMAKDLPAERVAKWLADPDTPQFRFGLYASMLGHCGKDDHAKLLRQMLDDPQKRLTSGVDGILAGYTMLKPKEGWEYSRDVLKDPSKDFMFRYAALRAARFFWEFRPDIVDKNAVVDATALLLDQNDIADLAIEDLRKWKSWELLDRILPFYTAKTHDLPIMRRAILRYALQCPGPKAAAFVDGIRAKDPELVKDVEELLKLESTVAKPDQPKK